MLKLEAILEEKAKKAFSFLLLLTLYALPEQRPDIIASTERKSRPRPAAPAKKKDIESLISNNLMKLRSLSPASKAAEKTKGSSMSFNPNFKSILSRFYPNFNQILSGVDHLDLILRILACFYVLPEVGI